MSGEDVVAKVTVRTDEKAEAEVEKDAGSEKVVDNACKTATCNEWSSPRGVLEIPVTDERSVSEEQSSSGGETPSAEKSQGETGSIYGLPIWKMNFLNALKVKKSVKRFSSSTLAMLSSYDISLSGKSLRRKFARNHSSEDGIDCGILPVVKPSWRNFEYAALAAATDNFSPERLLGKGGHAEVYKGSLSDGNAVAVKKLTKESDEAEEEISEEQQTADFLSELGIIAHIDHPNAAKLVGFSVDNGLFLVLQLCPQGSLASFLHGSRGCLEWKKRYKVALGVAEGLSYMHHTCQRRIIHRDIKASNILLAEDFEPLISDFGLAKWLPDKWLHHVVHPIEGTFGYLAPEYFMHGIVDEKTDVYAFGVLLLEIITGRHAIDSSRQSLVMWAKPLLDSTNVAELVDPGLGNDYDPVEIKRAMYTASMCIRHIPSHRPHMNRVVQLLRGEEEAMDQSKVKSIAPRTSLLLDEFEEYTSSNYLDDLNRHKELVME
ncbi:hypothetical protein Ancab_003598 [Ancistrocladus abbreviatus]